MQKEIKKILKNANLNIRESILFKNNNKRFLVSGFTLIETLVAVTLFTFVTFVALSSLFQMQQLNTKLKITKSIYNNIFFTVDSITSEIKQGSNFENKNYNPTTPTDCIDETCVAFDYLNIEVTNSSERRGYLLEDGFIKKYMGTQPVEIVTSEDLKIQTLKFMIEGISAYAGNVDSTQDGDSAQPSIKVIIKGVTRKKPELPFAIEAFISQRSLTN